MRYEIRLLGPFTVLRDGDRVADQQIGSRKARTLLKLLLVARDRVVGVDALAEVLWPGQLPDQPERHVATLVSRLRAALGTDAVVREGEGYRFGGGPAYLVDLDQADRLAGDAEARLAAGEPGLARNAADRALALLDRGELLADEPYADWAAPARARAAGLLRRARRSAWAAALAVRDLDRAVRVAEAAVADEPYDEEAYRALMRANRDRGSPGLALAAYERLRAALADELGTDPSAETRELHRTILRAEPAGAAAQPPTPTPHAPSPDPGVVGRDAELAWLRRAWSQASAGEPGLVLLIGEAGIGKTRLATEVVRLAEATGGTVARARCYEAERSLFLQPVADALRPLAAAAGPGLAAGLAELIPEAAASDPPREQHRASPDVERRRMFEAVAGLMRTLADRAPLLLFLDDLHQAGSSTLELLHFLLRRITRVRLLVLATVRVEEGAEVVDTLGDLAHRRDLGALPEDAVRELARRSGLAGSAARIMAHTRGHTLSVVETLRAMQEQPADPDSGYVPESLRAAVQGRMHRAGPHVEELLQAAATLGGSFEPALLAALLGEPLEETARRADAASRARLLVEAGTGYEFANELVGEIAYQATPLPLRIARHRRAAELLAGNPEAVAGHASRAGDWPAAMEAYLQAGEAAFRRYAHRDAERLLDQALAAALRAGDQAGVARSRLLRSRVHEALADYQSTYEDLSTVVDLAQSLHRPDLELAALSELGGDPLIGIGRPSRDCIPYLESALAVAERTGEVPAQVGILGRLAVLWTNRLRFDRASRYAAQAMTQAEPRYGQAVQAVALDAVKTTLAYRGDLAGLAQLLPRLQEMEDQLDVRYRIWAVFESAFPALGRAEWPQAVARIDHALTTCRARGYPAYEAPLRAHLAWVERARGRYGEALRHGRRAAEIARETGHPWWVALTSAFLGWTLTEVGALDEAAARLAAGLAVAERDATEAYLLPCLAHLAWASCLRGEPDRAAVLADRAESLLGGVTGGVFLHGAHAGLAVAAVRLALGEVDAATRLLEPLYGAAAGAGWVETVAWAGLLQAQCRAAGGDQLAAELATAALETAERGELPAIAWQAHALLAGLSRSAREAPAHRTAATTIVDGLAGSLGDSRLQASYWAHAGAQLRRLGC